MATTVGQHSVAAFTSPVNGTTPIDANTVRGNDNTVRVAYVDHDADPGIHVQSSTLASRPAAGTAGRKWITSDYPQKLWYDDGTDWHEVGGDAITIYCKATETIAKGDIVKVTGYNSGQDVPEIAKVSSASDVAFGIAETAIANGSLGYVVNTGIIQGVTTNSFSLGNILYPNTSGGLTATKPTSGTYQTVAYVLRAHATLGVLYVEFSAPRIVESSSNTASTVVQRDASGNFSAGTITAGALTSTGLVTFASLKGTGSTTVTDILNDSTMATASATTLATSSSIKTYVDNKVATVDTLAEVLANGNTTGANDIIVNAGQKIRTPLVAAQDGTSAITIANTTGVLTLATALADSNLATISTAGKVSNSATTATSANTASAIVARDASGNFTAGTITATLSGTATQVSQALTAGTYLTSGGTYNGSTARTFAVDATDANTASKVVARDASGNFSAGTITATLNGAAPAGSLSGSTLASGVTASSLTSVGTLTSLTVSGDLTVDTSTLKVDSTNNRVGIGTASPASAITLDVAGRSRMSGTGYDLATSPTVTFNNTTATTGRSYSINSTNGGLFQVVDDTAGGSTRLTVDSSGNLAVDTNTLYVDAANNRVGVGTASPTQALTVNGNAAVGGQQAFWFRDDDGFSSNAARRAWALAANYDTLGSLSFKVATAAAGNPLSGTTAMLLDASGNLGLGVTPSAWNTYKALDITGGGAFISANNAAEIWSNAFFDGAVKYKANGYATRYHANTSGAHAWYIAGNNTSGAGAALSFTQAMTLDASGNLLVGGTTNVHGTAGRGVIEANGSSSAVLGLTVGGTANGLLLHDGTDSYFRNYKNGYFAIWTNNTERARITSGGNFGVNSLATNAKLEVNATSGEVFRADAGAALRIVGNQDGVVLGGNIALGVSTSFGGGSRVVAIREAETVPTTNPVGNGILYVEGGALKYRGTSGTVTTIANA